MLAHRQMYDLAMSLKYFRAKDYAVLHAKPSTSTKRWERQLHLRKNHSVLWIFERTAIPAKARPTSEQLGGIESPKKARKK